MLEKKKKIGKKQLKEDKLVTFYSKSLQYYESYQKQILIAAAVLIVIIAAIAYFGNQASIEETKASAALSEVSGMYQSGNYQAAIKGMPGNNILGLAEVADKYSGTEAGEIARVYLANSYFYQGEYDKALEAYEDYSGDLDLYKAAAAAGEAACYEAKGDLERAAEYYQNAAFVSESNPQNSEYLLNSAVNYIKVGNYDEAKTLLENIKRNYEGSQEVSEADRYLAEIQILNKS